MLRFVLDVPNRVSGWMDGVKAQAWAREVLRLCAFPCPAGKPAIQQWMNSIFNALSNACAWLDTRIVDPRGVPNWPADGHAREGAFDVRRRSLAIERRPMLLDWYRRAKGRDWDGAAIVEPGAWDVGLQQSVTYIAPSADVRVQVVEWAPLDEGSVLIGPNFWLCADAVEFSRWAIQWAQQIIADPVAARTALRQDIDRENEARARKMNLSVADFNLYESLADVRLNEAQAAARAANTSLAHYVAGIAAATGLLAPVGAFIELFVQIGNAFPQAAGVTDAAPFRRFYSGGPLETNVMNLAPPEPPEELQGLINAPIRSQNVMVGGARSPLLNGLSLLENQPGQPGQPAQPPEDSIEVIQARTRAIQDDTAAILQRTNETITQMTQPKDRTFEYGVLGAIVVVIGILTVGGGSD